MHETWEPEYAHRAFLQGPRLHIAGPGCAEDRQGTFRCPVASLVVPAHSAEDKERALGKYEGARQQDAWAR
jgi:hypothetical protein